MLRLSLYQGLSHERIAEATGLPLGTVKTHVRRGLMRVREILAEQASGSDAPGDGFNRPASNDAGRSDDPASGK